MAARSINRPMLQAAAALKKKGKSPLLSVPWLNYSRAPEKLRSEYHEVCFKVMEPS